MRKIVMTSILFIASAATALAADFGELAGTYTGKTAKGGDVRIVLPKSGTPTYRFRGDSVAVNSASVSGKTVKMSVGEGGGSITLTSSGKGQITYRYSFNGATAAATLTKQ